MQNNPSKSGTSQGSNVGQGSDVGQMWVDAPFVKRFEMAVMQYVILNKAKQGEVTRDNLQQTFRGNLQMSGDHFQHCLTQLIEDGHLEEASGNKYRISDDGREDVEKIQRLVLELPQYAQGGQTQRTGVAPTTGSAGTTGGNVGGASQGGSQGGNVGGSQQGGRSNR